MYVGGERHGEGMVERYGKWYGRSMVGGMGRGYGSAWIADGQYVGEYEIRFLSFVNVQGHFGSNLSLLGNPALNVCLKPS